MTLKTIAIKGKPYVQVKDRLKYFRENFKGYALISELVEVNDKSALIRAIVKNEKGEIVATGTSYERADNKGSMVNASSHVENCESSAWGRALGNFGIGIDDSVASADEVTHASKKPIFDDTKDADHTNKHEKEEKPKETVPYASTVEQQGRITDLAKELNMDVEREICTPMKAAWPLTFTQALAVIKRLEQKKKELAAELDSK